MRAITKADAAAEQAAVNAAVGARVKARVKAAKTTLAALAERLGLDPPGLTLRCQGRTVWTAAEVAVAAEFLACTPTELLTDRPFALSGDEAAMIRLVRGAGSIDVSAEIWRATQQPPDPSDPDSTP